MNILFEAAKGSVPVTIARVSGRFDASTADYFNEKVEEQVKAGTTDLLLDLSDVDFISSIGIRSIGGLYDSLHPGTPEEKKAIYEGIRSGTYKAPHLKLLNPSSRVMDLFKMVSLDMYLEIFTDERKALAAF